MKPFDQKPINNSAMENVQTALETIDEFFRVFHLVEAQEEVTTLQQGIHKIPGLSSGERCEDLLYFCEKLKEFIAAVHQLRK